MNKLSSIGGPRSLADLSSASEPTKRAATGSAPFAGRSGFRCPRCGNDKCWPLRGGLLVECSRCPLQTSPTAGTIFENTRTPLTTWFQAFWWTIARRKGATAVALQSTFSLRSYQTAWMWLHKIRQVMRASMNGLLEGKVELGIFSLHPAEPEGPNSGLAATVEIALAAEVKRGGIGSVRGMVLASDSSSSPGRSLLEFVKKTIRPGSTIRTNSSPVFALLEEYGYDRKRPARASESGLGPRRPSFPLAQRPAPGSGRRQTSEFLSGRIPLQVQRKTVRRGSRCVLPAHLLRRRHRPAALQVDRQSDRAIRRKTARLTRPQRENKYQSATS